MDSRDPTEYFFSEKYGLSITRSDVRKSLCTHIKDGRECYHANCSYSHHPCYLFQVKPSYSSCVYWRTDASFQKWVLAYAHESIWDSDNCEKIIKLYNKVILNPVAELVADVEEFDRLLQIFQNQKEERDRKEMKEAQQRRQQMAVQADRTVRSASKQKADREAAERKTRAVVLREEIAKLRGKIASHFYFEADFLPPFMARFLEDYDVLELSKKLNEMLSEEVIGDLSEPALIDLKLFVEFTATVNKLDHRRRMQRLGEGDKTKTENVIAACQEVISGFEDAVSGVFKRLLGKQLRKCIKGKAKDSRTSGTLPRSEPHIPVAVTAPNTAMLKTGNLPSVEQMLGKPAQKAVTAPKAPAPTLDNSKGNAAPEADLISQTSSLKIGSLPSAAQILVNPVRKDAPTPDVGSQTAMRNPENCSNVNEMLGKLVAQDCGIVHDKRAQNVDPACGNSGQNVTTMHFDGMELKSQAVDAGKFSNIGKSAEVADEEASVAANEVTTRHFGHDEYLAVCMEALRDAPDVALGNCCKLQEVSRTLPLIKCTDCLKPGLYCKLCITSIHSKLKFRSHKNYLFLCPTCGDYRNLQACSLCSSMTDDFLCCETCQEDKHGAFGMHGFQRMSIDVVNVLTCRQTYSLTNLSLPANIVANGQGSFATASSTKYANSDDVLLKPIIPADVVLSSESSDDDDAVILGTFKKYSTGDFSSSSAMNPPLFAIHDVEMKPEIFDKEEGQIRMARVRSLLEDVVHPLLIQLFRLQWQESGRNYCFGCKTAHPFEDILITRCLSEMLSTEYGKKSKLSAVRAMEYADEKASIEHLSNRFDVTSIIQIISAWSKLEEFAGAELYCKLKDLWKILVPWRNESFHPLEMSYESYRDCFAEVAPFCESMYLQLRKVGKKGDRKFQDWLDTFGDFHERINNCKRTFTRLDIAKHMKEQWLMENKRSVLHLFGKYLEDDVLEFSRNSKLIGDRLCDSLNSSKFLILPKFAPNADRRALLAKLQFLTMIPWTGIIDLNDPPIWNKDEGFSEFAPMAVHLEDDAIIDDKNFGVTQIMYCSTVGPLSSWLRNEPQAYVVGFADIDYDEESIDELKFIIQHFHDNDEAHEHTVWPLIEDGNLLSKTSYLWKTKKRGKRAALLNPDPQALDEYSVVVFCAIELVAAVVFGRQRRPKTLLLYSIRGSQIGVPVGLLSQFPGLEVLTVDCDAFPKYTPLSECNIDFTHHEGASSVQGSSNVSLSVTDDDLSFDFVLKTELFNFLNGGEASWFLFQQNKVVKRQQLDTVVGMICGSDLSQVTLVHKFGAGGTSFARHVLYRLRESRTCIVANLAIKGKTQIDNFIDAIRKLYTVTGNKIVILIDVKKDKPEVSEPVRTFISIVKDQCHAFTTFLVTTSDEQWIYYFQKPLQSEAQGTSPRDKRLLKTSQMQMRESTSSSEKVVVLEAALVQRETDDFSRLLSEVTTAKKIVLEGIEFPLDGFGTPEIRQIKSSDGYMEIVNRTSPVELMRAGFSPFDLHELGKITGTSAQCVDRLRPHLKPKSGMSFLGLLQFNSNFKEHVRKYIQRSLVYLSAEDVRVLKLCVFYCLFTPTGEVQRHLAQYVYRDDGQMLNKKTFWSDMLLEFVDYNSSEDILFLKSQQLGYLLAESALFFGENISPKERVHDDLNISVKSILHYIHSELFPIIFDSAQLSSESLSDEGGELLTGRRADIVDFTAPRQISTLKRNLLRLVSEGLKHALCDFKIWHPGNKPPFKISGNSSNGPHQQKATLENAFLVELIIRRNQKVGSEQVRMLFLKMVKEYADFPSELATFATHAARFIAYQAQVRREFPLILEAQRLVADIPVNFKVAECRGNIRKRELVIYVKEADPKLRPSKEAIAAVPSAEETDDQSDDSEVMSDDFDEYELECSDSAHESIESYTSAVLDSPSNASSTDESVGQGWLLAASQHKKVALPAASLHFSIQKPKYSSIDCEKISEVLNVAIDASFWFQKAIVIHQSVNAFPMVACVQSWCYFLDYLFYVTCPGHTNRDAFVQLMRNPARDVPQPLKRILDRIKDLKIVDTCTELLTKARKAVLYKPMNSSYEHHDKSTNLYISLYQKRLRYMFETTTEKRRHLAEAPIEFKMTKVRILLLRGNISEIQPIELTYCLVTSAIELSRRVATFSQSDASEASRIKTAFFDSLDKFFLASSMITFKGLKDPSAIQDNYSLFSKAARDIGVDVSKVWSYHNLRGLLNEWSAYIQFELSNGLTQTEDGIDIKSYYGLDTVICQVLLNLWMALMRKGTDTYIEELNESLTKLWNKSDGCQHARKSRIFLAKSCIIPDNPFSQFIQTEQMDIGKSHRGDRQAQEQEYRDASRLFKLLKGTFRVVQGKGHFFTAIHCHELNLLKEDIRCDHHVYGSRFSDGTEVSFILGITNRGLWAHGLAATPPKS